MLGINWKFLSMYLLIYLTNSGNSLIAPFFPDVASERNIQPELIGLIFSCYPIGGVFFSLLLGKMMRRWGRKRILLMGLIVQIIGIIMFGILDNIDHRETFLGLALASRFLQGVGFATCNSIIFAFVPTLYPESIDEKIGYLEMSAGIGLMLGPLMGSMFYMIGGYEVPFYFMGLVLALMTAPILKILPNDEELKDQDTKKSKRLLSLRKIMFDRRMIVTFFMILIPSCGVTFLDPTFAEHLHSFGVGPVGAGIIFSINTLFYALSLVFFTKLLQYGSRAFWITVGGALTCFSFLLLGPEDRIGLPNELWLVCVGCAIMGVGNAFILGPAMPEFLELGLKIYPDQNEALGDMASGIYHSCWSLGEFVGPIIGGLLQDTAGFETGATSIGVVGFLYIIIYLTLGEAYKSFKRKETSPQDHEESLINKTELNSENINNKKFFEVQENKI